jgi:hypothetical protein
MAIYHRLESPSQSLQTAIYQAHSRQVWGAPARGSLLPSVKAYIGPLPKNQCGIEFETDIAPNVGSTPTVAKWYLGVQPDVLPVPGTIMCAIDVTMRKVANILLGISCVF